MTSTTTLSPPHVQNRAGRSNSTKLRLAAIAYTGLAHVELEDVAAEHLHLDDAPPWVWLVGRDKGDGKITPTAQPLTKRGAEALRALAAAGGLGTFSTSSMWKTWQRAARKVGLNGTTPYDLRHSFATEVLARTKGNLSLTQLLMRHRSQATTKHYAEAAVDPVRAAAVEHLDIEAFGGAKAKEAPSLRQKSRQARQPTEKKRRGR